MGAVLPPPSAFMCETRHGAQTFGQKAFALVETERVWQGSTQFRLVLPCGGGEGGIEEQDTSAVREVG